MPNIMQPNPPTSGPYIGAPQPTAPVIPRANPIQTGPVGIPGSGRGFPVSAPNPQVGPTPGGPTPMQGGDPSGGVRATGPTAGFDPSYLQNLATSDAGIFSRPAGGLSFNPLGNLASISGTSGGGNAPVAGIPQGMLTQALAANPTFLPQDQQTGLNPGQISTSLPNTSQSLAQMLQQVFGGQALANTQTQTPLTGGFTP
jgi:hypothetical protein